MTTLTDINYLPHKTTKSTHLLHFSCSCLEIECCCKYVCLMYKTYCVISHKIECGWYKLYDIKSKLEQKAKTCLQEAIRSLTSGFQDIFQQCETMPLFFSSSFFCLVTANALVCKRDNYVVLFPKMGTESVRKSLDYTVFLVG